MYDEDETQFSDLETWYGKNKIQLVSRYELLLVRYHLDLEVVDKMKRFFNEEVPDHESDPKTINGLIKAIEDLKLEKHLFWENKLAECQNQEDGAIEQPMNASEKVIQYEKEEQVRIQKRKASLQTNNPVFDQQMKEEVKDIIPDQEYVPGLEEQLVKDHYADEQNMQALLANKTLDSHGSDQVPDEQPRVTEKWPKKQNKPNVQFQIQI